MNKKPRVTKTARLVAAYSELLNSGSETTPEEYARQHPNRDPEYTGLLSLTHQLHAIKLVPKPLPPETRKRILYHVLSPILRKQAGQWQQRAQEFDNQPVHALTQRPEIVILLLYLAGRTGSLVEGIRGMIRMMKLVFLAQRTTPVAQGLTLGYEFVPFKFGPHSAEVYNDLQVLIWADLVKRTEYDEDGMPVIQRNDYGRMPEDEFAGKNALYELTPNGKVYAELLARDLERTRPELLKQLAALKYTLTRMSWQQIIAFVYERYPEYTTESELLKSPRSGIEDYGQC
jgi:hypothetical protein